MLRRVLFAGCLVVGLFQTNLAASAAEQPVRLYVLDGGVLESDPARYRLKADEVQTSQLSVAAFLIVHPKGTLMWDTGAISDDTWTPGKQPQARHLVLSNNADRYVTLAKSLTGQLKEIGYQPTDITYLALSHYHWDHVANANVFAKSTWLVRKVERDGMFPQPAAEPPQPSNFAALLNAKTTLITTDDYDVFGDGTVVIKSATGHTPGHSVLYVKLSKTGGVVLAGDLYHYPEERTLNRLPIADFDQAQTGRSREVLDGFLKQTGAQMWIQHDLVAHRKLKKAPAYYD
jgi:glyoxylase-like metal-dependent hydrolase (beta-lactamase superfamily II)